MTIRFTRLSVLAGVPAAAAIAVLATAGAAAADVHVSLPSQTQTLTTGDGVGVTLTRSGETATISPSLGSTPLHRNAWVSATYNVTTSKPVSKIKFQAGYTVGCQVNLNGFTNSNTPSGSVSTSGAASGTVNEGGSVSIGPGQAVNYYVYDYERADPFGNDQHKSWVPIVKTTHGEVSYTNETMQVNGCAGYAQARSFANVYIIGDHGEQIVSFYGQPFSLG
ncbi:MspA family porin [Gordonia polyisoprenivorans]|uniref:MspA family porin n=1 Tax=Gordonia polyisoprenivorans TaxID=84595 RepID=UPI000B99E621|nr:MspA family porin [Gordonia polyisoprenivorans]OZC29425.1 hypothetical protein CJJ17_27040 [Gordonia polyisoprenivorans]